MKNLITAILLTLVCNNVSAQKGNHFISLSSGVGRPYDEFVNVFKGEQFDGSLYRVCYKYGLSNRFLVDASIGLKSSVKYSSTFGAALGVNTILLHKKDIIPESNGLLGFESSIYLITDATYTGYRSFAPEKRHFGGLFGFGCNILFLDKDKQGYGFSVEWGYDTALKQCEYTVGITFKI